MFTAILFLIAKAQKQPRCPSANEGFKKKRVYTHNGIFNHKKKGNSAICDNLDGRWGFMLN